MNPTASLTLAVNFIKEHDQVVAYSPALDISTVGKSEEHAKQRFNEMAQMFLKDIIERNVVEEVLTELGWTKSVVRNQNLQWIPPVVKSIDLQVLVPA